MAAMQYANEEIRCGIYACSPEDSTFKAIFSNFELTDCKWDAHDGQPPDGDNFLAFQQ